ncbi:hypothetical protein MO973_11310 [Paenibacillus sp. TRM 82003]|nr:hypothetical protein [Paenibacillus sp. TRM 82003]
MGKKIDVYSDGSAKGKSLIDLVHKLACPKCEIVVHERSGSESGSGEPSVRIDGKTVDPKRFGNGVR